MCNLTVISGLEAPGCFQLNLHSLNSIHFVKLTVCVLKVIYKENVFELNT